MKKIYTDYRQIINYTIIGILTTIVSLLTYYICVSTILDPLVPMQLQIANITAWITAVTFAYYTNRRYVFNKSANADMISEAIKFYMLRMTSLLIDMLLMYIGVILMACNDKVIKLLVQIFLVVINYIFSKFFVFDNHIKNE